MVEIKTTPLKASCFINDVDVKFLHKVDASSYIFHELEENGFDIKKPIHTAHHPDLSGSWYFQEGEKCQKRNQ